MEQLTKNVFVKTGTRGCNPGFVVTSQGVVLIDVPGDPAYVEAYAEEIAKWGKTLYIINTEFHFDHNMTNSFFDTPVIASQITKDLIIEANTDPWLKARTKELYAEPLTVPSPEAYRKGWPTITFSDRMTICIGDHTFQIMLLPGHTPGQTAVYIPEEKVVFASDNISTMGGAALHDALPYKWLESLEILKRLDVRYIATGHGDLITSNPESYIDQQASAVRERIEAVKKAKADGLSVDEAAERFDKMFPAAPRPASEGYARPGPGASRRWIVHMFQVTGGNTSW